MLDDVDRWGQRMARAWRQGYNVSLERAYPELYAAGFKTAQVVQLVRLRLDWLTGRAKG